MIYVSSFNKNLYIATGKNMLESFQEQNPEDSFTLFVEDDIDLSNHGNVKSIYPLDTEPMLHLWLDDNADIIPKVYGGTFTCMCSYNREVPTKGHKKGCPAGSMRRRACHWYRKVVSWQIARELHDRFVWVDCDTILHNNMPEKVISDYLHHCPVRFHYGKFRACHNVGIETGIVMFDVHNGGGDVLEYIKNRFVSGTFRTEKRWDDAWILTVATQHFDLLEMGDLHPSSTSNSPMDDGPLSSYLKHNKGIHWRNHGVNLSNG